MNPPRTERTQTAKMTKSQSNYERLNKGISQQRSIKTYRNKKTSFFDVGDIMLDISRYQTLEPKPLGTIPESPQVESINSTPKTTENQNTKVQTSTVICKLPDYVWYYIMIHMDLPIILTKLMSISSERREFFKGLNSALFDCFLRTYGLFAKLRRTELAGKIELVPFLFKLERNMVRANREKALAEKAYSSFIEKQRLKRYMTTQAKRKAFGGKQMMSQQFLARPPEADDLIYEFDQHQFVAGK